MASEMDIDPPAVVKVKTEKSDGPKVNFNVTKWTGIALWNWDLGVDNCAICKTHAMEPCIQCHADNPGATNKECTIAWGICNHAFHFHCIDKWLKKHQYCPLDNKPWSLDKYGK